MYGEHALVWCDVIMLAIVLAYRPPMHHAATSVVPLTVAGERIRGQQQPLLILLDNVSMMCTANLRLFMTFNGTAENAFSMQSQARVSWVFPNLSEPIV